MREALASGLGMLFGGAGQLPGLLGFSGHKAGVLENQLGLGDIPSADIPAQLLGMAKKTPEYVNQYVLGIDPTKSLLGEALMKHGQKRFDQKQFDELNDYQKAIWLRYHNPND